MRTAKHLALVALAALSLGTGTAMAQEGGHDYQIPYWTLERQAGANVDEPGHVVIETSTSLLPRPLPLGVDGRYRHGIKVNLILVFLLVQVLQVEYELHLDQCILTRLQYNI